MGGNNSTRASEGNEQRKVLEPWRGDMSMGDSFAGACDGYEYDTLRQGPWMVKVSGGCRGIPGFCLPVPRLLSLPSRAPTPSQDLVLFLGSYTITILSPPRPL